MRLDVSGTTGHTEVSSGSFVVHIQPDSRKRSLSSTHGFPLKTCVVLITAH